MRIHISETTYNCLQTANYVTKQRGSIDIKVNMNLLCCEMIQVMPVDMEVSWLRDGN